MRRRLLELGVLAALLASLLTIPLPLPHVATATAWVVLSAVHVARRRRIYVALLRSAGWSASQPPRRRRPWPSLDRVMRDAVGYQYGTVRRLFNVSSTRR